MRAEFEALQPQIQSLRLSPQLLPSAVPPMMSACIHEDWEKCGGSPEVEVR